MKDGASYIAAQDDADLIVSGNGFALEIDNEH